MSEVITIRVSKEIRELMKESKTNWSDDIRNYIIGRAKSLKLHKMLGRVRESAKKIKIKGDSTMLIKEERYGA